MWLSAATRSRSWARGSPERAASVAQRMIDAAKQGTVLEADDVLRMSMDGSREPGGGGDTRIVLPGVRKIIQPKTPGQAEYLGLISDNDIVVGIGPAGTGKTYLAVAACRRCREAR